MFLKTPGQESKKKKLVPILKRQLFPPPWALGFHMSCSVSRLEISKGLKISCTIGPTHFGICHLHEKNIVELANWSPKGMRDTWYIQTKWPQLSPI